MILLKNSMPRIFILSVFFIFSINVTAQSDSIETPNPDQYGPVIDLNDGQNSTTLIKNFTIQKGSGSEGSDGGILMGGGSGPGPILENLLFTGSGSSPPLKEESDEFKKSLGWLPSPLSVLCSRLSLWCMAFY